MATITKQSTWWLWDAEVTVLAVTEGWVIFQTGIERPVALERAEFITDASLLRRKTRIKSTEICHIPGQMELQEAI